MAAALFIPREGFEGQETTRELYNRHNGYLEDWMNGMTIDQMTVSHWEQFIDFRGWGYKSQRLALSSIRYWLREIAHDMSHPIWKVEWPQGVRKPQRTLTISQRDKLLEVARNTRNPLRDTALIRLLWDVGGRKFEIASATWENVDLEERTIYLLTKAEDLKPRQFELKRFSPETAEALQELKSHGAVKIFGLKRSGITMLFRRLSVKVGFPVSPHDFRRGLISHMTERGVSDTLGMQQTGIKTHRVYAQYGAGARLKALDGQIW